MTEKTFMDLFDYIKKNYNQQLTDIQDLVDKLHAEDPKASELSEIEKKMEKLHDDIVKAVQKDPDFKEIKFGLRFDSSTSNMVIHTLAPPGTYLFSATGMVEQFKEEKSAKPEVKADTPNAISVNADRPVVNNTAPQP